MLKQEGYLPLLVLVLIVFGFIIAIDALVEGRPPSYYYCILLMIVAVLGRPLCNDGCRYILKYVCVTCYINLEFRRREPHW